jgi:hypothetical protein
LEIWRIAAAGGAQPVWFSGADRGESENLRASSLRLYMQRAFLPARLSRSLHRRHKAKGVSPSFCTARTPNKKQKSQRFIDGKERQASALARHTYVCGRMKLYSKPVSRLNIK